MYGQADHKVQPVVASEPRIAAMQYQRSPDEPIRRSRRRRPRSQAEAAFSIEQPWQSHGVGTELLERTLLASRNRGIKQLHITCFHGEPVHAAVARKFDAKRRRDCDCVIGEVEAPCPTPMSLMREMIAGGTGMAMRFSMPSSAHSSVRDALRSPQRRPGRSGFR
jgi:hypothetical protein